MLIAARPVRTKAKREGSGWRSDLHQRQETGTLRPMTSDTLAFLPLAKQHELAFVVDTIRKGFAFAIERRTMPAVRGGRLLKIILFGSYARGDWVADPVGRYFSDYDLLLVVDREELTDVPEYWAKTEEKLLDELASGKHLRTPVSLIVHSLDDVNDKLRLGRYFFIDIVRDGIALFEEPGCPFVEPKALSPAEALRETEEYFDEWFESACRRFELANAALEKGYLKEAAFDFHQATERFYHCLFLVRTLYSPKTHNLNQLRRLAEELDPRLKTVWPRDTRDERRAYELLREAYVKARYSRQYRISGDQLAWLSERIGQLQSLVRDLCNERLIELAKAA
ncbi:HEPN domain-containing protein [Sphingomonas sp. ASV193]|uniref:HEPN domain-containing protein n=1 Tax=Sphingomonas sp. ASV193 TaxID=3144405 RepID=UPI0032E86261